MTSLLLGLLAYGALIEILQSFTTFRSADWHDLLADGLGLLPVWLFMRMQRRKRGQEEKGGGVISDKAVLKSED